MMPASTLVRRLSDILPAGAVAGPASPDYERLRKVWSGTIDRRPAVVTRPETAPQVAAIVRLAAADGLSLAVRGGGHSFPGFSTCDGGIVLDLSRMNRVTVDAAERVADVGGGALLGDLDRAGARFGLVTPAGLVSHTGVGGLTLGGGMGWTSRRLGLTIDCLLGAEVVTADGRIIEVGPGAEPELFWGLRGGGGNFGVVTRFQFRMHALGKVTVGRWLYAPEQTPEALNRLASLAARAPRSQTTALNVSTAGLSVTAFHSGDDGLGAASIAPFAALAGPGDGGIADMDYVTLQSRSDGYVCWGRRYYARGGFLAALDSNVADTMSALGRTAPTPDAEVYMIQLGGAVADVSETATAYSGRGAGFYWIVQPIWDDPADDARCLAWGKAGGRAMAALSQAGNYLNEQGDVNRELTIRAYGQVKYDRLARLKARFDPGNLFRLNQNIVPSA
jgi:FAD/FMN-containing dehydrogenase